MLVTKAIPGSAIYTGTHDGQGSICRYMVYNANGVQTQEGGWPPPQPEPDRVDWYDFRGLGDTARVVELAKSLSMPDMALEDALDVAQRPKYEEYPSAFLFTLDYLRLNEDRSLRTQKVTLYWTKEFLLTLQEFPDDLFLHVSDRIEKGFGRVRKRGTAYLAYALIDNLIDDYIEELQRLELNIDQLETSVLDGADEADIKRRIYRLKITVNKFRSTLMPLRDAVVRWAKSEHPGKEPKLGVYLRDLSDNVRRASDLADEHITRTTDLYQLFTSELTIRTNKVVQLLTAVSAIFIPLTFLTGLYGMNFDVMPELHWRYGYLALWVLMLSTVVGLLGYFKRKGWW